MKVSIEIDEAELKRLVMHRLVELMGDVDFKPEDVVIEVKSKMNYRAEWEVGSFRAKVEKHSI